MFLPRIGEHVNCFLHFALVCFPVQQVDLRVYAPTALISSFYMDVSGRILWCMFVCEEGSEAGTGKFFASFCHSDQCDE